MNRRPSSAPRAPGAIRLWSNTTQGIREPLNNSARSAFWSERPQIGRCGASDSSHSYGRAAQRSRCGLSGKTRSGRACAGPPTRLGSLIWIDQTTLAQAAPETPAQAPSRPCRVVQRTLVVFSFRCFVGAGSVAAPRLSHCPNPSNQTNRQPMRPKSRREQPIRPLQARRAWWKLKARNYQSVKGVIDARSA